MKGCWKPTEEEAKHLKLVMSMSIDCLMEKGTSDKETYLANLEAIIVLMKKLPTK